MKILVTGCEGMLGRTIMRRLAADYDLKGVDLVDGDLTDPHVVTEIMADAGAQWVVHCAAWTDVDGAESAQDQAMAANALATENVASACDSFGAGLCFISTDYVFDGQGDGFDEDDPRFPVNHYGLTKARAEDAVMAMEGPWQILRTSWLFGDGPKNFVKTIRRLLGEREQLRVVDDQRGCPTYAEDLADVIGFLVSGGHRGIFHGTNAGPTTWYELARRIAAECGLDPHRIVACPSSEYPTPAVRPPCSVLRSTRLEDAGCPPRPAWPQAMARYLDFLDSGQAKHP
jgi:dTDP-4-dehydrorhamnose reductase